jgi:glycosyltransferase involved in cell wall biosynthesis
MKVCAIIPALNEADAIGQVVASIDRRLVSEIIVADNGSRDHTAAVAVQAGARVVTEIRKGYGWACLAGLAAVPDAEIILFLDGDGSDDTSLAEQLIAPIAAGEADLVLGSRVLGQGAAGALSVPQRFGNWLSSRLLNFIYKTNYTDLGPFRAIRKKTLDRMMMSAKTYGWTVEMQIKAAAMKIRIREMPVNPRQRQAGKSKVSGTVKGVILAGGYILFYILKAAIFTGAEKKENPHDP